MRNILIKIPQLQKEKNKKKNKIKNKQYTKSQYLMRN